MVKLREIFDVLSPSLKNKTYLILFFSIFVFIIEMLGIGVLLPLLKILTDDQFATSMPNLAKFISFFSIYDFKNFDLESEKLFRIKLIIGGCGIIVITFFIKFIFLSYYSFLLLNYKSQIQSYLSFELLKKYSNVELEYYFNKNSSELVRNITSDVSHFSSTIMSMIILLVEFFIFIGVFFILISQQPLNSLFTLLIFSLLIFTMYSLSKKKLLNYGIKRVEFEGERIKIINQIIEGFKQIKILGITQNIIKKFYFFNKNSFSLIAKIGFIGSAQRHFLEFFLVLCLSIIIFLIILKTKNYNELIYSIGLFSVAMFRLFPSFAKILSNFNNLRASRFSVVKVFNDLTEIPSENEKITDEKIQFKGQIAIKQLSFTYKSRPRKILENINLEIQKGEMIGFIGESGSGKSTLIELLMGFLKPSSGKILIDGKDIFENLREWRNQIGYVTQKNYLEDGTIASNIALGIPYNEINNQRINICVNEAQLDEFIKTLKDGIETKVGERGIQLSEGQRKRIEIARALYNNPEVLFLDEATSSLDKNTEKEFFKIIKNLKNKKTIIIISHDLHTLEDCDRIFNIYNNSLAIFKK